MEASMILLNFMEVNGYKQKEIANLIGVSVSTLSNFLAGGRLLSFKRALLVQSIFFKGDLSFIRSICRSYEKPEYVRPALELLSANYFLDDMKVLLSNISSYPTFADVYDTYSLVLKYQEGSESFEKILEDIRNLRHRIKDNDLLALLAIIESNIYFLNRENISLSRSAKESEKYLVAVEDGYIKESLKARMYEVLGQAELTKGNLEKCRKYAKLIISQNISEKFNSYASYLLGTSYMFLNYKKAVSLLEDSKSKYLTLGFDKIAQEVQSSIYFTETYWGVNLNDIPNDMTESEQAHRYAKRGDYQKALYILDNLEDTPFRIYYRALAMKDSSLLFKSLGQLIKMHDYFYQQLPVNELKKYPEHESVIQNLID